MYEWFKDAVSRRVPVTGPLLQTKALDFANRLNVDDFKASKGWLQSFQKRNNIVFGTMCGERGDVNSETVSDWIKKVPKLCEGYEAKNIFNMDESGLFYRDTTRKTLHFKTDDCAGGKRSKERLTFSLCASMTGEKLKVLLIGKSKSPRCFGKIDTKNLPVHYYNNKKTWMTSSIFEDYMNRINRQMRAQNRHILMFIDNAPSHPTLRLSNIKVLFFPPNTTSRTQPMDAGIIQATKLKFRKRQLLHLTKEMDRQPTASGTEILKKTTILNAIYWLKNSWAEVEADTISKCFAKCGFCQEQPSVSECECVSEDQEEDDDDDIPLSAVKLANEPFGCSFTELAAIDDSLHTCETMAKDWDSEAVLEADVTCDTDSVSDDDDEEPETNETCVSAQEAHEMVLKLKNFAINRGSLELIDSVQTVEEQLTASTIKRSKQTKIKEFFQCARPL